MQFNRGFIWEIHLPPATFPASILLAGCGPWQKPHGFLIVFCSVLVSGHWFDHGGPFETEFDRLFWLTRGLQVTRSRGALLQWKRGWPWIFEPTNGPPERLSCRVCLTWACQKRLQSLHIFFLSSVLDAETHWRYGVFSGSGLQPLDNQHFGLRVNLVVRGQVAVDVKFWCTGVLFIHTQELIDQLLITGEALI